MNSQARTVEEWFLLNEKNLIVCPNQLGDLKITLSACRRRRQKAWEWNYGTLPDNPFFYGCEQRLLVCRECQRFPWGKANLTLVEGGLSSGSNIRDLFLKGRKEKDEAPPKLGERAVDFSREVHLPSDRQAGQKRSGRTHPPGRPLVGQQCPSGQGAP
jgi:hypothetical protein